MPQNIALRNTEYPTDPDPTEWVMLTKNGDKRAFNKVVNKYQQPIYNFCYQMLHQNRDEAEDAAQEVFLRAYTKLDTYDDQRRFSTWLFSIASHYCIDTLRSRRYQLVSWDSVAPWYPFSHQEPSQPERALLKAETAHEVQMLLNVLPPNYRAVIILKYWHTLSYQEIAQTLGTTISAIKSKLFRARRMMATQRAAAQMVTHKPDLVKKATSKVRPISSIKGKNDDK